ncbi:MAG TPA: FAD-linked oxidase C-terminal domain-containing protein [Bacteroidota bacterium]|nr:FAD-linked oxidase C-terminal domain-containing protein [Bacteroidota bacterium]
MDKLEKLATSIQGEIYYDNFWKILYATDASDYREIPRGVVYPKTIDDIKTIIDFARTGNIPIIPRGGGTSLAGQTVGNGLVVDISRYFTKILEINEQEHWACVEPGVIPDVLNQQLRKHNLFWGPETSTSNRNTLAGMLGNNSCGSHFPLYKNTRANILEVIGFLSDGSQIHTKALSNAEIDEKIMLNNREGKIYSLLINKLKNTDFQNEIYCQFPKPEIERRNSGYAIDSLLDSDYFLRNGKQFNLSKLLAGSEGTLLFTTEMKINLVEPPPSNVAVIAAHFNSLRQALQANIIAMNHNPGAVELIDDNILELTKENIAQRRNRFFLKGNPAAILVIEFARDNETELNQLINETIEDLRDNNLGYDYPILHGEEINRIWELRKAGLGLLSNIKGEERSYTVIEDTAVSIQDLPDYTDELIARMQEMGVRIISYAHCSTGEIHFHPILNLHTREGIEKYRNVLVETAKIVKKYRGSLCGEHGDGRLRGEMIPFMYGENIYNFFKEIKATFDPDNIFNPGKIVDAPRMNTFLRVNPENKRNKLYTYFNFDEYGGIERFAEKCNGSGDCRKPQELGGTLCPSYKATRNEKDSTRARANMLREMLNTSTKSNPFDSKELYEVMDLCLMCKACKSECPSSVDMARLKSEFLQHYYDEQGEPFRTQIVANISLIYKFASNFPQISNFFLKNKLFSNIIKNIIGFAKERHFQLLSETTLQKWYMKNYIHSTDKPIVYLFNDEFTNYQDADIGIKAIKLLDKLGYNVIIPEHTESGRAYLSKGFVKKAKEIANENVNVLKDIITDKTPLIGIEPSAILSFRDEYPDLVDKELREDSMKLAENCLLFDEFICREILKNRISQNLFTDDAKQISLHTHCHQKSLSTSESLKTMLTLPKNYTVSEIPSGCCGMAGSFGFEKEHYAISQYIGELILFPSIRKLEENVIIAAPGTSCRHQIMEGTGRIALHPIEILYNALK